MLKDQKIICFAPSDYWTMNPSCTTHIMSKLSKHNKILYINPFSSDIARAKKQGLFTRISRKAKSLAKFLKKPKKNLYVFSPLFLPLQGSPFFDTINNFFLKLQLKIVSTCLGMSHPVLWIENLRAAEAIEWFAPNLVVYHVSDLFSHSSYLADKKLLSQRDRIISQKSDILICVSQKLYEIKLKNYPNVYYLSHGVDFQAFANAAENPPLILDELFRIKKPIAGYFGTLTDFNDIELLVYCAQKLPQFSFVFAGQITAGDYSELKNCSNVYFTGKIPYQKIPQLCESFDLCLLPWKVDEWIKCCNPLKFMEYMASGKPIVSIPIDQLTNKYSDLISIAADKYRFCNAILYELKNDTPQRSARRIEIARSNSWDNKIQKLSQILTDALEARTQKSPTPKIIVGACK